MNHDYYAILGVEETADLAALRVAYFRRARECHPDRGGSHAQMVLLNEAWEVLSHPESRRHYDAARSGATDAAAAAAFEQEVAAARRKAADYPAEWASFELWLESVAREFTETRYGTSWIDFDNVTGGSVLLFIGIGAIVGLIFGVLLSMNVEYPKNIRQALLLLVAAVSIPTFLGMLLGKLLHYLIASGLQLGGVGNLDATRRISEAERWRMGACAGGAALGLLLIADRSEFQFSYGIPQAQAIAAGTDACLAKLWYGAIRGGVAGAVLCYSLAKMEIKRTAATLPPGKLPENFVLQAGLYGGIAFGVAGALFGYLSFPKTSGTLDLMRIVVGAVMGGLACGLILLAIKKAATVWPTAASGPQASGASAVIPCVLCGKKLRVPRHASELWVTCPACSHKFTYRNQETSNSSSV